MLEQFQGRDDLLQVSPENSMTQPKAGEARSKDQTMNNEPLATSLAKGGSANLQTANQIILDQESHQIGPSGSRNVNSNNSTSAFRQKLVQVLSGSTHNTQTAAAGA